jgi:nicotinamide-nucleotide amidase
MKDNIFKCFGISKDEVRNILSPFLKDNKGVFISIDGKQLLVDILLQAEDSNTFFYELSHEIYERFSKYVYAEADISLEQTAFELLKLNGIKLATAESITGGNLIGSLIKYNPGASDFILKGCCLYIRIKD